MEVFLAWNPLWLLAFSKTCFFVLASFGRDLAFRSARGFRLVAVPRALSPISAFPRQSSCRFSFDRAGLFRGGARASRGGLSCLAWLACPVFPLLIRLSRFFPGPLFPRLASAILRPSRPLVPFPSSRLGPPRLGLPGPPVAAFLSPVCPFPRPALPARAVWSGLDSGLRPRLVVFPRTLPRSRAPSRPVGPPRAGLIARRLHIIYRCRVSRLGGRGVVPRSGRLCIRVVPSDLRFI